MASTLRLYGPEVGIPQGIVDADVTGVTLDGRVELTPTDDNEPFVIEPERISELASESLAYDLGAVDTADDIWSAIADVEEHYEADTDNREPYPEAAKVLFRGGP